MTLTSCVELPLSSDDVRRLLPHSWPFVYVDRVTELVPGIRGTGIKNVTASEAHFAGHFPTYAVMPGVLIVEALTQLSGIVFSTGVLAAMADATDESFNPAGMLAALKQIKFRSVVVPGDQLSLEAVAGPALGTLHEFRVRATVEGRVAVEGALAISASA